MLPDALGGIIYILVFACDLPTHHTGSSGTTSGAQDKVGDWFSVGFGWGRNTWNPSITNSCLGKQLEGFVTLASGIHLYTFIEYECHVVRVQNWSRSVKSYVCRAPWLGGKKKIQIDNVCYQKETGTLNPFELRKSFSAGLVGEVGWGRYSSQRERHRIMKECGVFAEPKTTLGVGGQRRKGAVRLGMSGVLYCSSHLRTQEFDHQIWPSSSGRSLFFPWDWSASLISPELASWAPLPQALALELWTRLWRTMHGVMQALWTSSRGYKWKPGIWVPLTPTRGSHIHPLQVWWGLVIAPL